MRHRTGLRLLAVFLAACFGVAAITPMFGDPCPHDAFALAELAAGNSADAAPVAGHVHHAMPTAGHADGRGGHAHHHSGSDQCTCLGACCAGAPVALVSQPPHIAPPVIADVAIVLPASASRAADRQRPHALPFSTAPPPAANA